MRKKTGDRRQNTADARQETELTLRIVVNDPPPGVVFKLQRGSSELDPPARSTTRELAFEFPVRVGTQKNGAPNFLGPYTQGPPAVRFVYVNSGTLAGQAGSCWSRRAKIPLTGITRALIDRSLETGKIIETSITGTGRDGGPCCATVPLNHDWHVE